MISHSFFHGVSLFGLGLSFGSLGSTFGSHVAPIGASVGSADSWYPGCHLGSLVGTPDVQLGDFVPSWEPRDANLGISWMTLSPLGSNLASFGYLVCE